MQRRESGHEAPAPGAPGQPIRVGIVGMASLYWPTALAENLRRLPEADLRAAASMGASDEQIHAALGCNGAEFADRFGVRLYDGIEEMIEAEALGAVAVCTRHTEHADHVDRAAAAGADVYICKTMATTDEDCARIVRSGKDHGVRIAVGPGGRFQPHHVLAAEVIRAGRIGRPIAMRVSHNHGTLDVFDATDWYRDPAEGGPELSLGWYVVDVMRAMLPRPVRRVSAQYHNFATPLSAFMDQGKVLLRFDDDTLGACDMYFSNRFGFPTWDLEVIGTGGAIRTHVGGDDGVPPALLWTPEGLQRLEVPPGDNWTADTAAWVRAFADKRPAPIDAEEGRTITEICLACRESARQGRPIDL